MAIIPEPLLAALRKYCEEDVNNCSLIENMLNNLGHTMANRPRPPIVVQTMQIGQPSKQLSPHAPVAHAPRDHWVKVITAIDTSNVNGFGIKGYFINPDDTEGLSANELFLVCTKDGKVANYQLCKREISSIPIPVIYPNKSAKLPVMVYGATRVFTHSSGQLPDWRRVFEYLLNSGIRTT